MSSSTPLASTPNLYALLVGINEYANIIGLDGAVSDVQAIKRYLIEVLKVPETHIRTLINHEATRVAIIRAFRDLVADQRIDHDDPILIFYAGHGVECNTPPAWYTTPRKIQCLLPQDCKNGRHSEGSDVIPDRTVAALIEEIAQEKGNNITVIFDCCHSASGTRVNDYTPRTVKTAFDIPANLDRPIWGNRAGSADNESAHFGLRSHVLLAACGEEEFALEDEDGGHFTKALISLLRAHAGKDVTYAELCQLLHSRLREQTPRCEGNNQHRVIFDTRQPVGRQAFYSVEADPGSEQCVIHAGRAHGVSTGVEFTLYNGQKRKVGLIVLQDSTTVIDDFKTTVVMASGNFPCDASLAKVTRVGKLSVYVIPGDSYPIIKGILRKMSSPTFNIVETFEEAQLMIGLESDGQVMLNISDPRLTKLFPTELTYRIPLDHLNPILDTAAHYFWYLHHDRTDDTQVEVIINHAVDIVLYHLKKKYDFWGFPHLLPDRPGLCPRSPTNVVDFVIDQTGRYGIEMKNNTPRDLYLNAFMFNNSGLSIVPYYTQQTSGNPEPPLKRNGGTFTIGYGSSGNPPFVYSLEEGQDVDVGYLKIFFATRPIDMCSVECVSPLQKDTLPSPPRSKRQSNLALESPTTNDSDVRDTWFTALITIVQRRN